jgi:aspartokinase/homoserine dehydrogenase 1
VRGAEATRALRAVHAAFRLSHQSVRVGVVMSFEDSLGCALLELLKKQREKIMVAFDIDVQVIAVANESRLMYTDNGGSITKGVWDGSGGSGDFKEDKVRWRRSEATT